MACAWSCLRLVMLGCFIGLGISGIAVCIAGSVFTYQLQHGYQNVDIKNLVASSGVLIALGLLTCPLATYFWWFIDTKYNRSQCILFTFLLIILSSLESVTGFLALQKHDELGTMFSASLEHSLKSFPRPPPSDSTLNHTEIKLNCCSSHETSEDFVPWLCCDFQRHENTTRIGCEEAYGTKCRHLTINRYQSILIHVFLLALCSVAFQILVLLNLLYYVRIQKKQVRRSTVVHI